MSDKYAMNSFLSGMKNVIRVMEAGAGEAPRVHVEKSQEFDPLNVLPLEWVKDKWQVRRIIGPSVNDAPSGWNVTVGDDEIAVFHCTVGISSTCYFGPGVHPIAAPVTSNVESGQVIGFLHMYDRRR